MEKIPEPSAKPNLAEPIITRPRVKPKDIIMNLLSAALFFLVALFSNLFLDANFEYKQIFGWNIGLLVLVNWVCGIAISYCLRQNGIYNAKQTSKYKNSDSALALAFEALKDYSRGQIVLNYLIAVDFNSRRKAIEKTIATLVKEKSPNWKLGDKLPDGVGLNAIKLNRVLTKMAPPQISLTSIASKAMKYEVGRGMFDVPDNPAETGVKWFVTKGGGKIGWFALAPIGLSILASALITGSLTLGSVVTVAGTLAIIIFNAAMSYATAYRDVSEGGVARNYIIIRIIKAVIECDVSDAEINSFFGDELRCNADSVSETADSMPPAQLA